MSSTTVTAIGRDHPAHRYLVEHLRSRMSDISENTWCAGWLIDLEFILWDAIHGGPRDPFADEDLRELEELSALTGGWHNRDRFIPLEEWLSIAREHALQLERS